MLFCVSCTREHKQEERSGFTINYGAHFGANTIWFATSNDMMVFKSFDEFRQTSLILSNSGKVLTFKKDTNANN